MDNSSSGSGSRMGPTGWICDTGLGENTLHHRWNFFSKWYSEPENNLFYVEYIFSNKQGLLGTAKGLARLFGICPYWRVTVWLNQILCYFSCFFYSKPFTTLLSRGCKSLFRPNRFGWQCRQCLSVHSPASPLKGCTAVRACCVKNHICYS